MMGMVCVRALHAGETVQDKALALQTELRCPAGMVAACDLRTQKSETASLGRAGYVDWLDDEMQFQ